jgi:hypothetical protein
MAAAVLLLTGAGLLTVSFVKMRQADPGFRTGNILTVGLSALLGVRSAAAVNYTVATPGYFQALGIPMLRGRHFTGQDRAGPLAGHEPRSAHDSRSPERRFRRAR